MKIKIIACMGANRVIGKDGKIPWKCSDDMHFFKFMTWGKIVIMGRKTYESLPNGPLDGRMNYVISSASCDAPPSDKKQHMPSLHAALEESRRIATDRPNMDECWVIGGASIYTQALPIADEIYLNVRYDEFEGDTFFPPFEMDYELVSCAHKQYFSANHYKRSNLCP